MSVGALLHNAEKHKIPILYVKIKHEFWKLKKKEKPVVFGFAFLNLNMILHLFPQTVVTNCPKLGGLQQQKWTFPESGTRDLPGSKAAPPPASLASGGCWPSWVSSAWIRHQSLTSLSRCVLSLCLFSSCKDPRYTGLAPSLTRL